MKIKKFTALTMKEALVQVKAELGDDAMILKSRKLPKSLVPGKGGGFEVTAAVDDDEGITPSRNPRIQASGALNSSGERRTKPLNEGYTNQLRRLTREGRELRRQMAEESSRGARQTTDDRKNASSAEKKEKAPPHRNPPDSGSSIQIMKLHDELNEMRKLLASILATGESRASGGYAGPWAILFKRLRDSGIKEDIAADLINNLKETVPSPGKEINSRFIQTLSESFPTTGEGLGDRIHVFVGPTGAGKTTTIAKLAAYFSLEKGLRVALITSDTYRIAAVEQLRTYAEIIGVELQVAFGPEDIPDMVVNCAQSDVILVDTAGRSQQQREHLDELDALLAGLKADARHLVLSAGTKEEDLRDILRRYRRFDVNRLVFTKLDETVSLGNVYNIVNEFMVPVSFLTFGQSVPDDIEFAQSGLFVKKMLERSSL
ncbi:MAG: flagellar biosynthesis protein FlhF [Fibrobacterota bacterium]